MYAVLKVFFPQMFGLLWEANFKIREPFLAPTLKLRRKRCEAILRDLREILERWFDFKQPF